MTPRRTLGLNIVRHEQMRSQRGGILPMGAVMPNMPILPMLPPRRSLFSRIWGRG